MTETTETRVPRFAALSRHDDPTGTEYWCVISKWTGPNGNEATLVRGTMHHAEAVAVAALDLRMGLEVEVSMLFSRGDGDPNVESF